MNMTAAMEGRRNHHEEFVHSVFVDLTDQKEIRNNDDDLILMLDKLLTQMFGSEDE